MKWKAFVSAAVMAGILFAFTPGVDAHVTVRPEQSSTGAYEKYTVRVPVEKEIPTTEVELKIPDGVEVVSVMPKPGWEYDLKKSREDRTISVTWKAKDDGLKVHEFTEFALIGANPDKPGKVSWKAHQTYEDGSVVKWSGAPDSEQPASVTEIREGDSGHGHGDVAQESEEAAGADTDEETAASDLWPTTLAGLALILSLISLFRKKA
ncbi:hypothetical protein CHM34_11140 [Paludifilum halophilum]|uniref:YncI copper-binding domain-containing protein n=2 Tax=Paludifilum halophilum TaxID=1642702 RepID=A0A235B641_9BACL|nr:hypothetical protein CHM34_11140 [Paludifilum halophilum]